MPPLKLPSFDVFLSSLSFPPRSLSRPLPYLFFYLFPFPFSLLPSFLSHFSKLPSFYSCTTQAPLPAAAGPFPEERTNLYWVAKLVGAVEPQYKFYLQSFHE
jgi:hypothetical protein